MPQSCAPRVPPCWQAAMLMRGGAPFQFGPLHPVQLPPGEVCQQLQSCCRVSVAQSCTRPSFCCDAVTCRNCEFSGVAGQGCHPLHEPPAVIWKQVTRLKFSSMPQSCAPRVPPCCEAAMRFIPFGALFQFGPLHADQLPPGEVCQTVQSCSIMSSAKSCTRPSFCCAAASS